jgi:transglutaminase-like putative cysteine protease/Na+-transporting methylmalonyl-CoA/oxaloacetate decarboxylase gamma subunit
MKLDRYYLISSYSLLVISFLMLLATGRCDLITSLLFAAVLFSGWMIDAGRWAWGISKKWSNWLMMACLGLAFLEWRLLGLEMATVVLHLTLFASSLKILRRKKDSDWLWLYVISFCLTLMTAGMTVNAVFLFLLILYLFSALSTLIVYEIRRTQRSFAEVFARRGDIVEPQVEPEYWREENGARKRVAAPAGRSLLLTSFLILALILLLATPLFLVMPRMARAGSRNGMLSAETLTGFSETVRLGEVAQVKQNPQVVMRVRVRQMGGEPHRAYRWRGVTLNYYDGQSWSETIREPVRVKRISEGFRVTERTWARSYTEQRFFLEPIDINIIFAAPHPVTVTGLRELYRDGGDGLWTEDHSYFKLDYAVYSDTSVPTDLELAGDNSRDFSRDITQQYLQLPQEHDQRITELAAEITKGASTQIEIARRIEKHLQESYGYTLDLKRVESGDPVADFLFHVKAGHCEYFASAMVLLLRSRRIPARLVNGFQTGEYNPAVDIYTVRQSDAHSWVEVYFPIHGWVAFDPTPAAGLSSYSDGVSALMRRYGEAMEMFWLEHVVGFDTGKQLSMARAAQSWLASYQMDPGQLSQWMSQWHAGEWFSEAARSFDHWRNRSEPRPVDLTSQSEKSDQSFPLQRPFLLLATAGAASAFFLWRRRYPLWRRRLKNDAGASAVAFYQEMLRTLERGGDKREPHQTPAEFAAQLSQPPVTEITRLYERIRFGNQPLNESEATRVGAALRELAESRKRRFLSQLLGRIGLKPGRGKSSSDA